jgi:hypothetical protein
LTFGNTEADELPFHHVPQRVLLTLLNFESNISIPTLRKYFIYYGSKKLRP